jgi:hypothetical protein
VNSDKEDCDFSENMEPHSKRQRFDGGRLKKAKQILIENPISIMLRKESIDRRGKAKSFKYSYATVSGEIMIEDRDNAGLEALANAKAIKISNSLVQNSSQSEIELKPSMSNDMDVLMIEGIVESEGSSGKNYEN